MPQPEEPEPPPPPEPGPPPEPAPALPADTVTAITQWPSEARRKTGYVIGGTVYTVTGSAVSGMGVEIFINETKEHGGARIGATTAQNGRFQVEVHLPSSMERGSYRLIAHAMSNNQHAESWSDPGVTVYSESGFELTGPKEVNVDEPAVFQGRLLDNTGGSGVADSELQVTIDGRSLPPQLTGPAGQFSFANAFPGPGNHQVEVEFDRVDFLLGNSVRLDLSVVLPTKLTIESLAQVKVGETFPINGTLHDVRGRSMADEEVTFTVGNGRERIVRTNSAGEFGTTSSVGEAGEYVLQAEFAGEYPVLPSLDSACVIVGI